MLAFFWTASFEAGCLQQEDPQHAQGYEAQLGPSNLLFGRGDDDVLDRRDRRNLNGGRFCPAMAQQADIGLQGGFGGGEVSVSREVRTNASHDASREAVTKVSPGPCQVAVRAVPQFLYREGTKVITNRSANL